MTSSSEARRSPVIRMRAVPEARPVHFGEVIAEPVADGGPDRPAVAVLSSLLGRDAAGAALRRAATGAGLPAAAADHAAGTLAAAEREAREIGWQAGYEEGRRAGHDAGYAEGHEIGTHRGEADAAARLDAAAGALRAAAAVLAEHTRQLAIVTEDRLAAAAFDLAEAIVDHTIADDPERGRTAVARALGLAPDGTAVLRLNPGDVDSIEGMDTGREVSIVADPGVGPGGCIAVVGATIVDASIESALDRAREVLRR